jgi:transposase
MTEHRDSCASGFTSHDRRRLQQAMQQATSARLFRRLQAVLRVAEGESIAQAACRAAVDRNTVHRWVDRYQQSHRVEDLADLPSPGRPFQAEEQDERLLAQVLAEDPHESGFAECRLWAGTGTRSGISTEIAATPGDRLDYVLIYTRK